MASHSRDYCCVAVIVAVQTYVWCIFSPISITCPAGLSDLAFLGSGPGADGLQTCHQRHHERPCKVHVCALPGALARLWAHPLALQNRAARLAMYTVYRIYPNKMERALILVHCRLPRSFLSVSVTCHILCEKGELYAEVRPLPRQLAPLLGTTPAVKTRTPPYPPTLP